MVPLSINEDDSHCETYQAPDREASEAGQVGEKDGGRENPNDMKVFGCGANK